MSLRQNISICVSLRVAYCFMFAATGCIYVPTFADDIQKQIDAMQQRLDAVQNETQDMRGELDTLQAENIDWLTKERAEQIKELVHDVLADAESRKSLSGDGILGGWSDGFFLASSDGRFKLKIGGLIQERLILNYQRASISPNFDRWRGGLENTRTRLNISGHIFDRDTTFLVQAGWGWLDPNSISNSPLLRIGPRLWDSWIKFKLSDQWSAKLGVFMIPFTRESLVSDELQLAVDRSLIDYRVGLARSQGVEFTWAGENTRVFLSSTNGSLVTRDVSAASANPTPPWAALSADVEWSVTARVEWLTEGDWGQFKQFTSPIGSEKAVLIGVAAHAQHQERTGSGGKKKDKIGITADVSMQLDGISFFLSGTIHNQKYPVGDTPPNADWVGYVAQASTYTTDNTELFMRFEGGGVMQNSMGGDDIHILTSGVNWYLDGQGLKVTSDFGWSFGEISAGLANQMVGWRPTRNRNAEWLFRTQLQLAF
jgi:hypothetical protein